MMTRSKHCSLKVLLVGYNGANNTGSEARLLSIIQDVRSVMGSHTQITVPTLNEKNLRRYLAEDEYLHICPIPSIFIWAIAKLVKEHDLVILIEGSCYMDTWTSALLWAFLWTTNCAYRYRKPCIAYAVDAGALSKFNRWLVKREASKTDLIITRTVHASKRLKNIGVTARLISTADCAFTFYENLGNPNFLENLFSKSKESGSKNHVVGLAVVDFSLWPVKLRLWGSKKDCYKWPYYFSRSFARRRSRDRLVRGWAQIADQIIEEYNKKVILVCMESVDQPLAEDILLEIKNKDLCRIVSSNCFHASQITSILSQLDLLVTSRYHSAVLSLHSAVPQIAVGHDFRLKSLYQDLHLYQNYYIHYDSYNLWDLLISKVRFLLENTNMQRDFLQKGWSTQVHLAKKNKMILGKFLKENGIIKGKL
jgi:polysaccharide pyruvyl transferase WcaK-like protein